ncbi:hypothetical protein QUF90_05010 [Desulfococcaceae bacterium HSG9]|nr:hypothetical protein [Desulfococcaceae bacterium HSG9]
MRIRKIGSLVAAIFCFVGFNASVVMSAPKTELIKKDGFRRDAKDGDPEIHLKSGYVLEAKKGGHLEVEKGKKDLGDRYIILPNKKGSHNVYVIKGKKIIVIMKNVKVRRDKGDGDWEILLSRKGNLWLEIDTDCESKEFLMGELETGTGKDIDLIRLFGRR